MFYFNSGHLLHLFLHLARKKPRLTLLTRFYFAFAIGFGFQAFVRRTAAFLAASRGGNGNGEQEKEENTEITGKLHIVSCE